MSKPSLRSSPWILGAPQSGLANDIFWMKALSSEPTGGRPWPSTSRLPGPEGAEPLPMPADDGLWPNQAQGIAPARPALRKPDPEDAGDSSELRPLGAVAQEGQLLPKREILERQMAARFQGGADRAQQSEQGGPHGRGSLVPPQVPVKSGDRDLAKHNQCRASRSPDCRESLASPHRRSEAIRKPGSLRTGEWVQRLST